MKINIIVGKNINLLTANAFSQVNEPTLVDGEALHVPGMVCDFPEARRHPSYIEAYVQEAYNFGTHNDVEALNIRTHSHHIIEILGDWISDRRVKNEDVLIFIVSDYNIGHHVSGFDKEGYLLPNWPCGFLNV